MMSINVGDLLRKTREEKNMTLEDVSEETKIQKRYLKALEEERYEELPGEVHVKGFMRNYCRTIGLNPDEVVEMYKMQKEEKTIYKNSAASSEKTGDKFIGKLILLFVLVIVVIVAFKIFTQNRDSKMKNNEVIEKIETSESHREEIKEQTAIIEKEETEKKEEKIEEKMKEETKEEIKEKKIETKKEVEQEQAIEKNNLSEKDNAVLEKEIFNEISEKKENIKEKIEVQELDYSKDIKIIVDGKSWMEIKKNNEVVFSGIVEKNEQLYKGTDNDEFEMKIGNAGSVSIIYNGDDLGVLGKPRQVVRRKF